VSGLAKSAHAHPLSPASLSLVEVRASEFQLDLRRPLRIADALAVAFPTSCVERVAKESLAPPDFRQRRAVLRCTGAIEGQRLRIDGLEPGGAGAVLYLRFLDGRVVRAVLTAEAPSFVVPHASTRSEVFVDYLWLGIEHLLSGADHLLFVLGLMLLVQGTRRIALTLTAFTLGHSLTLSAATLGFLRLPQGEVELGIALSLVLVALEVVRGRVRPREPFVLASAFGLLHGYGFAGALSETGLPPHEIPLSLFAFNLGVEVGQLGVVLVLLPCAWLTSRLSEALRARLRVACAYAMGAVSAMWCIERALLLV
jgi:hydrogenase/urease accessory protein HupE